MHPPPPRCRTKQRSIQDFTRVSKSVVSSDVGLKKRKLRLTEDDEDRSVSAVKKSKRGLDLETPPETPTKAISRAFHGLSLVPPAVLKVVNSAKRKRGLHVVFDVGTPTSILVGEENNSSFDMAAREDGDGLHQLPTQISELKRLNSALLTALSLHYAHHGTSSPVDVSLLSPSITHIWGKRKVMLEDIQICFGITDQGTNSRRDDNRATFTLSNYANGKMCVELHATKKHRGVLSSSFDEEVLNARFGHSLDQLWMKWTETSTDVKAFIAALPLAEISNSTSYAKIAPILAKGQRRLEQVMKPRIVNENQSAALQSRQKRRKPNVQKLQDNDELFPTTSSKEISSNLAAVQTGVRGLGLIERIREKEIHKSTLPAQLTSAQLARAAALQRATEILSIIDMLAASKSGAHSLRVSFPFPTLVRSVQGSIRSPMSREEIERCVDVLVMEIATDYVAWVEFGSMRCVAVSRAMKPRPEEVKERLVSSGVFV